MQTTGLVLRVVLSLTLVLCVLWLAARGLRKGQRRSRGGVDVDVLSRQPLSQRSSVAVVRLGERALVLGVTDTHVELLTELALADVLSPVTEPDLAVTARAVATTPPAGALAGSALSPQTWSRALDAVRTATARR